MLKFSGSSCLSWDPKSIDSAQSHSIVPIMLAGWRDGCMAKHNHTQAGFKGIRQCHCHMNIQHQHKHANTTLLSSPVLSCAEFLTITLDCHQGINTLWYHTVSGFKRTASTENGATSAVIAEQQQVQVHRLQIEGTFRQKNRTTTGKTGMLDVLCWPMIRNTEHHSSGTARNVCPTNQLQHSKADKVQARSFYKPTLHGHIPTKLVVN